MNDPYSPIAQVYESVMGPRDDLDFVYSLIKQHAEHASQILELACGTGNMLEVLRADFSLVGVDVSQSMIKLARRKLPDIELHIGDMRNFQLNRKFDVVLCVFDSINHLLLYSDWKKVFRNARRHLNKNGIFIFDMNAEQKFLNYENESPLIAYEGQDICIFDVQRKSRGICELDIRYFEQKQNNKFQLHRSVIKERTFPISRVRQALQPYFSKLRVIDEMARRPQKESETIYWICKV